MMKRFPVLFTAGMLLIMFACAFAVRAEDEESGPHTKPDGTKYRFSYVDYDEYLPASRSLYYILAGLEENGWISEGSLPFDISDIDANNMSTREMYEALVEADLGPYIEFAEDAFYYLAYDDRDAIKEGLTSRAGSDIDFVITFGTSAGVFVKELGLSIPMVDFSATDPVASGIIESSTEGSGNPYVWAQVEPSVPLRQLKYYHSLCPFDSLGIIVYGDETISGVPDIVTASEDIGFKLTKYNIEEQPRETQEELEAYYKLVESEIEKMCTEDIDAFYLTADLINDLDRLRPLLDHFYELGIPVYLEDDPTCVEYGVLMLICASDIENVGRFVADAISQILNGAEAGSLPCIYTSAPSIYVNYEVARKINYPLTFDFLSVCDTIYTGESADA